ncbi:hypothetical protein KP509_28G053900 [Ceratopteris richardii]|uniref:Ataxin-2 C-terminal domain-containing protein n=1 Tax=Ceratopteris richardii TaxID=49495 RepID=A0A8T2RDV7_CERRI|nr:hypothetical protein KP509_28G053900 [Ceratopteris richardii]KAH7294042.1 hypothetical protein KP509_28G053900 [Ceratopteris richardii]
MAVQSRSSSHLNPNASLFLPTAYLQVDDFSPEWWRLVHSCPAFRDYWLRDRYDCCGDEGELTAGEIEELDFVDDLVEFQADLIDLEMAEEAVRFLIEDGWGAPSDSKNDASILLEGMNLIDMQ